VAATATKVNLRVENAWPALEQGLVRSLTRLLSWASIVRVRFPRSHAMLKKSRCVCLPEEHPYGTAGF